MSFYSRRDPRGRGRVTSGRASRSHSFPDGTQHARGWNAYCMPILQEDGSLLLRDSAAIPEHDIVPGRAGYRVYDNTIQGWQPILQAAVADDSELARQRVPRTPVHITHPYRKFA